ncbi:hypothetical protein OUZ56_003528 [Daphnia magna]|uniref:Uncharacterized protein n=1 Tax=Daphnia magna TaxID=35525 RepID=A0ABR0A900_9CRUS|nr:hypothetical protein OUZ56_003528 [Daphnia magna]
MLRASYMGPNEISVATTHSESLKKTSPCNLGILPYPSRKPPGNVLDWVLTPISGSSSPSRRRRAPTDACGSCQSSHLIFHPSISSFLPPPRQGIVSVCRSRTSFTPVIRLLRSGSTRFASDTVFSRSTTVHSAPLTNFFIFTTGTSSVCRSLGLFTLEFYATPGVPQQMVPATGEVIVQLYLPSGTACTPVPFPLV